MRDADTPSFVLASASPRRADLLSAAGFAFTVEAADIDETPGVDEAPEAYVERLSVQKASAIAALHAGTLVLGADTTVVVDGEILGKPTDDADARRMIRQLAGRRHLVHTGVAFVRDATVRSAVSTTAVWFGPMTEAEVDAYVATGEPRGKAGAYAIQGRAARYVTRIDGAYDTVVGLPVGLVYALLSAFPDAGADNSAPAPVSARFSADNSRD